MINAQPGYSVAFRILAAIITGYIAHQKGRDWINWSILALFAPFIAIAGVLFVEKREQSLVVYPQMNRVQNSTVFCEKAMRFLDNDQFEESLVYAEKALQLDAANMLAREIMKSAQLNISSGSDKNEHPPS